MGVSADRVAYVHRFVKDEAINRDGGDAAQRVFSGGDAASDIHLTHQSVAEDFAGRVGVGGHSERAQVEVAVQLLRRGLILRKIRYRYPMGLSFSTKLTRSPQYLVYQYLVYFVYT